MRMSCPRSSWGNAKMGGNLNPMQWRELMALLTKQWRSQEVEGGVSKGKVWGGGCSGHAEHGLYRGVCGHAPPEKIRKMASLRLFLVGFGKESLKRIFENN